MPAEARRSSPAQLRMRAIRGRKLPPRITPEQIKAIEKGRFRHIRGGKAKQQPLLPGKIEREVTVRKGNVTTTILHFSNGHQKWAFVSIEDERSGKKQAFKLTPRQHNEWVKRSRGKGDKRLLASLATGVIEHPDALAHAARTIGVHGGKEVLQALFDFAV